MPSRFNTFVKFGYILILNLEQCRAILSNIRRKEDDPPAILFPVAMDPSEKVSAGNC
jgi:hypothetical protein